VRISIPAYFDPRLAAATWHRVFDAALTTCDVVLNPDSGPGAEYRAEYADLVQSLERVGIRPLGYVSTGYAHRSLADVESDIDTWYAWYRIGGIFADEVSCAAGDLDFYASVTGCVRSRESGRSRIAFNPGTHATLEHMQLCDVLVNWEGSWSDYRYAYPANPLWVKDYAAERFWHIVHGCRNVSSMRPALVLARERHAARVYVTGGNQTNPYADLPEYWHDEVRAVSRVAND
jgi:hypothetical protein